jgi:hypothetical protein
VILADATFSTEQLLIILGAAGGTLAGALGIIYRQLIKNYELQIDAERKRFEDELANERADTASWQKIATDVLSSGERAESKLRRTSGETAPVAVVAVVPEGPSKAEQDAADIQTAKARAAALKINLEAGADHA